MEIETELLSVPSYEVSLAGFLGVLHHYMRRLELSECIDSLFPAHGNWQGVSIGVLCEVFLLYLISNSRALYRAEEWYEQTPYLRCLYPDLQKSDLTDDRLGILLDKLSEHGVSSIYNQVVVSMLQHFDIDLSRIHFDLTNFTLYGDYPADSTSPIQIVHGFSKHKRSDLKQVKLGAAVAGDSGILVGMQTYDGNQADVSTYVDFWRNLTNTLGRSDFLLVGDCKLCSRENLLSIMRGSGYFLTLAPRYKGNCEKLSTFLAEKPDLTVLRQIETADKQLEITYKGGEFLEKWTDPEDDTRCYHVRYLAIWSRELQQTKHNTIDKYLNNTLEELGKLKINTAKFKTFEQIEQKVIDTLEKHQTEWLIDYTIESHTKEVKKKIGKGRPGPNTQYEVSQEVFYTLSYKINEKALEQYKQQAGHYLLITNQTEDKLSLQEAFNAYKDEYKVEKTFARANNPIIATCPMFLQKPKRINAMLLMVTFALQLFSLIDHKIAQKIEQTKEPLQGILPNKIKSPRPKTEQMIRVFDSVRIIKVTNDTQNSTSYIATLNPLQRKILELLEVPIQTYYSNKILKKINELTI